MTTTKIIIILSVAVVISGVVAIISNQIKRNQKKDFGSVTSGSNKTSEPTYTFEEIKNSIIS